jgi:CRISPR system Cascade subunit CasD
METLILRFDAPLMSFGAPIVDNHGRIQPYPALSMICGMLGNALGYDHREFERLQRLQARIQYASRCDRRGKRIEDFQTVNLGADYMSDKLAWTTDGSLEERKGGSASSGTHIRYRDYWGDSIHTVAVHLSSANEKPTLEDVKKALEYPERPLFLGRKPCLPAAPICVDLIEADSLRAALSQYPLHEHADEDGPYPAWWPTKPGATEPADRLRERPVTDERDWANQIHVGERWIAQGNIEVTAQEDA